MIFLDTARDVARASPRQHEQGIDDEDADPLDADGDDNGEQGGEERFDAKDADAAAARKRRIHREQQQPIEEHNPAEENESVNCEKSRKISGRNAQDIADEERGELREASAVTHHHEPDCNCRRGEHPDDRIR